MKNFSMGIWTLALVSCLAMAAEASPSITVGGEWKLKPGGEPVLQGLGQVKLHDLPEGDYILSLEPGDSTSEFPLLFPGGFREDILAGATVVSEFPFHLTGEHDAVIYMGGRSVPASWTHLEITNKDHSSAMKLAAADYIKTLPAPITLAPYRIKEIAAMLPEHPAAMGPSIDDRAAWAAFAARNPDNHFIQDADQAMKEPVPALPDELFLTFKNKGTRRDYEVPFEQRRRRLGVFVMAECLTNQGHYLDAISRELEAILEEKTWVLPAHDAKLDNFNGRMTDIDLGVSVRGLVVATTYSWLGDKLPAPLREKIVANLRRRVIEPYQKRIRHVDDKLCWWVTVTSNWNAVCHAGVIGTALAILPSREERAEIVAGTETYLPFFLSGLAKDGYGEEGLGYWNYGFGHDVIIAETVLKATGSQLDWYNFEAVRKTTTFPPRLEMQPGVYPAFGDCAFDMKPFTWVKNISGFRVDGLAPSTEDRISTANDPIGGTLYEMAVAGFPLYETKAISPGKEKETGTHLRDWFAQPQVLICRSAASAKRPFAVAIKGGRNSGTHFHLDLGEFLVAVGGKMPLVDPGIEIYTARSKVESDMVNSFGHSVPVVAGKGQGMGKDAEATVLSKSFTPEKDELRLDLTHAYEESALEKLTRSYLYSREGECAFTVTDDVTFREPRAFGGSLLTYGNVTLISKTSASVTQDGQSVHIEISCAVPLHLEVETVKTINKVAPTRIKLVLDQPVIQTQVKYLITPQS